MKHTNWCLIDKPECGPVHCTCSATLHADIQGELDWLAECDGDREFFWNR